MKAVVLVAALGVPGGCVASEMPQNGSLGYPSPQTTYPPGMYDSSTDTPYSVNQHGRVQMEYPSHARDMDTAEYWRQRQRGAPAMYEVYRHCEEVAAEINKTAEAVMKWLRDRHETFSPPHGYIPNSVVFFEERRIQHAAADAFKDIRAVQYGEMSEWLVKQGVNCKETDFECRKKACTHLNTEFETRVNGFIRKFPTDEERQK